MAKVADVKLSWVRSPSADVVSRTIEVTINGQTTTADVGPEVEQYMIEVSASGSVQFKTTVKDAEDQVVSSEVYSFTVGDLEAPQPDTGLLHEIVGIRDVPDA